MKKITIYSTLLLLLLGIISTSCSSSGTKKVELTAEMIDAISLRADPDLPENEQEDLQKMLTAIKKELHEVRKGTKSINDRFYDPDDAEKEVSIFVMAFIFSSNSQLWQAMIDLGGDSHTVIKMKKQKMKMKKKHH